MKNSAREVVDKMFVAFASGDVEKFVDTVSEDTVWIYHGTQLIPAGVFEKKGRSANIFHQYYGTNGNHSL